MSVSIPHKHGEPQQTYPKRRIGLIVLGMHRSGTSALTRVLSLLGADLPNRLMGANRGNDTGHWEPQNLVTINDQLLSEGGSSWDDWRRFDWQALQEKYLHFRNTIAVCLQEDFGDSELFALKDPRICRLVPLFKDVSDQLNIELRYIIPYRSATDVAASLNSRDGITIGYAKLIWARYMLDAEASTRGSKRIFVPYDALLSDFEGVCNRIGSSLDVEWPISIAEARTNIAAYVRPELRHHRTTEDSLPIEDEIAGFADRILANIVRLDRNSLDEQAMKELSLLGEEINNPRVTFLDATFSEFVARRKREADGFAQQLHHAKQTADATSAQLLQLHVEQEAANMKLEQFQRQQVQSQNDIAAAEARAEILEQSLKATLVQLGQLHAEREAADMKLEQFQRQQFQSQNDLAAAEARAEQLEQSLKEVLSSYYWRATGPLRMLARLLGNPAVGGGHRSAAK